VTKTFLGLLMLLPIVAGLLLGWGLFGPHKLVLRLERPDQGYKLQNALVFEGSSLKMTRNTNYWCSTTSDAVIGKMTRPMTLTDRALRLRILADAWLEKIRQRTGDARESSIPSITLSGTRIYAGYDKVAPHLPRAHKIRALFDSTCGQEDQWTIDAGIHLQLVSGREPPMVEVTQLPDAAISIEPLEKLECEPVGENIEEPEKRIFRCSALDFGFVWLF